MRYTSRQVSGDHAGRKGRPQRRTTRQCIADSRRAVVSGLIQRALEANRKAKAATGDLKRLFYSEKTRCLRRAIELSPEDFFISESTEAGALVGISSYERILVHIPTEALAGLPDHRWRSMLEWARGA